jgi:hypothetical protein
MNYRIKEPKQVVLHAQGGSGAGFIDGVWHELEPQRRELTYDDHILNLEEAPQRKEWVGLTDDEVSEIIDREIGFNSCFGPEESFARAIEAKLKEKNNG